MAWDDLADVPLPRSIQLIFPRIRGDKEHSVGIGRRVEQKRITTKNRVGVLGAAGTRMISVTTMQLIQSMAQGLMRILYFEILTSFVLIYTLKLSARLFKV